MSWHSVNMTRPHWWQITIILMAVAISWTTATTALPPVIRIGAIFEPNDHELVEALHVIVDRINNDRKILPRTNLVASVYRPPDAFSAAKTVCDMFQNQTWLLLTSRSDSVNWFARSVSDMLQIPHLAVKWDYRSAYMDNVNFIKPQTGRRQTTTDDATSALVRGSNGGYYLDPVASGNAETGFRLREVRQQSYRQSSPIEISSNNPLKRLTLNLFPDATELSEALKDFIDSRNWKSFTLIYDSHDGLIKCKDLLALANSIKPGRPRMKISVLNFIEFDRMARLQLKIMQRLKRKKRQWTHDTYPYYPNDNEHDRRTSIFDLPPSSSNDHEQQLTEYVYRKLWKEIKSSEHNFVLSMEPDRVVNVLLEAKKIRRMTEYDNYFIVTMDIHTYDLAQFQELEPLPNITALSLLSERGQHMDLGEQEQMFRGAGGYYTPGTASYPIGKKLSTQEALVYDAMTLFARALDDLDRSRPELIVEPFVACEDDHTSIGGRNRPWPLGPHIVDFMRNLQLKGVTGLLLFNQFGFRVNFTLDVLQLKQKGLKQVAKWTRRFGIKSSHNFTFFDSYREILDAMKFKELRITVPPSTEPYVMLKDDHENYNGNEKFYGYCIDLLKEIADVFRQEFDSDFKYVIFITPTGTYGRPDKETGEWNGMFGELIRHQADLAIADLTATYLRETAVDFTMPFMNLGITILFKKPSAPEPEMFSFLKPFSVEVWLYLASAFLGISLLLWIMSRISPYEWESPHSCDPDPVELVNQFSIGNSLWFTIGSLMQQGSDLAPRALSTRTLATIWWFFTLIIISSYTANLAASLTLSRMAPAISSAEDLAKQTSILYGCRKGGSTHEFFANSNNSIYQRMYNTMESNPEVYINTIKDAIERVRKGGYAYLAESSTIEYLIQRRCDLIQVGNWLDNKGYGIATPPDSPYRTPISNAITVLQDRGTLYQLKQRWWVEKGGGQCTEDAKVSAASELNIENVGGVFLVLAIGIAIGVFGGFVEFVWKSLKVAPDERESIAKLIWLELFRICTGGGSSRPVFQSSASAINMAALDSGTGGGGGGGDSAVPDRHKTSSFQSVAAAVATPQFDNSNYFYQDGSSPEYGAIRMRKDPQPGRQKPISTADSMAPLLHGISTKSLDKPLAKSSQQQHQF